MSEELKWSTHALGPARNWDIFAASLVRPVSDALSASRKLEYLVTAVERHRREAIEDAKQAILSTQNRRCAYCNGSKLAGGMRSRCRSTPAHCLEEVSLRYRIPAEPIRRNPSWGIRGSAAIVARLSWSCKRRPRRLRSARRTSGKDRSRYSWNTSCARGRW